MSLTVLLVDDDADSRAICRTILAHHGYEVLEAMDGAAGLTAARARSPDLIVMDVNLPVLNGWSATQQLKSGSETGSIPVIVFTARATSADRERAMSAGCDGYLTKPCPPSRFVEEVRRVLGGVVAPPGER